MTRQWCWALVALACGSSPAWAEDEPAPEAEAEAESEAEGALEAVDPEIFNRALSDYYDELYADAAAGFWGYMKFGGEGAENYEWAQFFLAESLRSLGLWHGATQYYYSVARSRTRPEILPEALSRLEAISRLRPFSEKLVNEALLYDAELGTIPARLADWVHYVQGLYDYKNGFVDWAERHYGQIRKDSPYALRAAYVRAVYLLKQRKDSEAKTAFEAILSSEVAEEDVKNKTHLALARLLFDSDDYEGALVHYEQVKQINLSFEQAELLSEKAWAYFYLGQLKKALGLLHALEAPSYERYFVPDSFVLRAIIMKDLCHFIPAKRAVRSFRSNYNRTLVALHRREGFLQMPRIVDAATQEGSIARRTRFMRTLERERKLIEDYDSAWEDVGLDAQLRGLYDFELREQRRLWTLEFEESSARSALHLLEAEEQMDLLDYEVGLDIFERLKAELARRSREESVEVPYDSAYVYYEFDDEYWNDELHSYEVFVQSRCFEEAGAE